MTMIENTQYLRELQKPCLELCLDCPNPIILKNMLSLCSYMWGAGVAAVPRRRQGLQLSLMTCTWLPHLNKPQPSWELRRCTRILANPFWWRYAPAALISWSCVPGEVTWPAVSGWGLRVYKSERPGLERGLLFERGLLLLGDIKTRKI